MLQSVAAPLRVGDGQERRQQQEEQKKKQEDQVELSNEVEPDEDETLETQTDEQSSLDLTA